MLLNYRAAAVGAAFVFLIVFFVSFVSAEDCGPDQVCSGSRDRRPTDDRQTDDRETDDRETDDRETDDRETDNRCGPDQVCSGTRDTLKKPNIIFVLLDDVGYHDVGWNNPDMHTPHMNKLASEGVILTNHYSLPTCTPSRASFLSGYHASRLGLQRGVLQLLEPYGIPTKFTLLPAALKKENYATHALGKWHVGYCSKEYTPMGRGFDTFYGFYNGAENNYMHCNRDDIYFKEPNCSYYDFRDRWAKGRRYQGEFSGHLYGKRAEYIIKKHDKSRPLFMYLALSHTHFPLQAPPEFCRHCDAYDDLPARKKMCCAMAAADSVVANVTDALKRRRMYDNTVIVVVSDNGGSIHFGASNLPYKGNKGSLWEGGSKTPAFVHSPLLKKKGYKNKSLFHITDWYPTFVSMAGGKVDEAMDGFDQWKTINLNKKSDRHEILYNIDNQTGTWFVALRKDNWKLIIAPPESQEPNYVYPESEVTDESFNVSFLYSYTHPKSYPPSSMRVFLYDLVADEGEEYNHAESNDPVHKAKLKELREFSLSYYVNVMKPAVKMADDPAGSPEKDSGWYWVGWCRRYQDVPEKKEYSDLLMEYPR